MIPEDGWNENDYNKWRDYPPGEYWGKDLFQHPHPHNTCSFTRDGYPVLVSVNYEVLARLTHAIHYSHRGWIVTVWLPHPGVPIISEDEVVRSLDDIEAAIVRLKEKVNSACKHPNSERLPRRYPMLHEFKCLDCGKTWGYDSSD